MDVIVIMTGVLSRGVRDTGPTGFNSVQKHLIIPAKGMGGNVNIWAFNNIPKTVDGREAPQDGARSLYPEFDHYVEIKQEDIDSSDRAEKLRDWLWKSVFIDNHCYRNRPGPVGVWCVNELQPNIVRLEYMEELAMNHLATEVKAGKVKDNTIILLMSPEMIIPDFNFQLVQWAIEAPPAAPRALAITASKGNLYAGGVRYHDGVIAARTDVILHWWHQKKNPTKRHIFYEQWFEDSLRGIVCRSIGSCAARPRHKSYLPTHEEEPIPWHF